MELTNATDLILLHRWRASRDAEAFRALAERYAGLVFAAAHRVLRDPSEAEDVAQECFLTLAQARKPPERNLGAWLHAAAVNRAKNHIRGEVRRRQREQHYNALQPDHIQTDLDDTLAHVDDAIAALDDELRYVIIAHFLEAKSQGEIADTTGVSRQTVNARVKRGVEAIREHLAKKGITATTASLTTLLGTQMVEAVPAALVAALGKVALSGGVAAAGGGVVASLAGLLTTKVAVGLAAILLAVLSIFTYQEVISRSLAPVGHEATRVLPESAEGVSPAVADALTQKSVPDPVEVLPASSGLANGGRVLAGTILDENGGLMKRPVTVYAYANRPTDLKIDWNSPEGQRYYNAHIVRIAETHDGVFELDPYTKLGTQGAIYAGDSENNVISDKITFNLSSGDQRDITLRFRPYGSIAGTLLDRNGAPVTGATVTFRGSVGAFEAKVDEKGHFATAVLPPDDYEVNEVRIGSPFDHEQDSVRFPMSVPNILVREGMQVDAVALVAECELTEVSGRIVDGHGRGVPNLRLSMRDDTWYSGIVPVQVDRLFTETDAQGAFDFRVYGPGFYGLDVVNSNYEFPDPVTVRSSEIDLELHARVGGKKPIRFRMVDGRTGEIVKSATSHRIEGPNVVGENWRSEGGGPLITTISLEEATGAVALFTAKDVGVATYPIKLSDLGGPEILISLMPVAPIEGQVLDSEGNPKANVRIQDSWGNLGEPRTRTDAEGRFQLTDLDPGQDTVFLYSDDAPQMQVPVQREGKWVIRLSRGATISGVVTAGGTPVKGLELTLWSRATDGPSDNRKSNTDAEGHYMFLGVAEGNGFVQVEVPLNDGPRMLGFRVKEVEVSLDQTAVVDFEFDLRMPDGSLRGKILFDGEPAYGRVSVQSADGDGSDSVSSGAHNAAEGFHIEGLVSGDAIVKASRGICSRTFSHRLTPGENTLDIPFSRGGAVLECTFPFAEVKAGFVGMTIEVDTEFGLEVVTRPQWPLTSSGIRIEDLPEGTATITVQGSQYNRGYERRVKLISGATTTIDFSTDNALIDFILSGVQDSEQVVVFAFPGIPVLPDADAVTPDIYMAQLNSLQPIAFLERPYLARPLKHLEAGTYTLVACAFPGETAPASGTLTPGFRTFATEVTLEPGSEAQVTLAFP